MWLIIIFSIECTCFPCSDLLSLKSFYKTYNNPITDHVDFLSLDSATEKGVVSIVVPSGFLGASLRINSFVQNLLMQKQPRRLQIESNKLIDKSVKDGNEHMAILFQFKGKWFVFEDDTGNSGRGHIELSPDFSIKLKKFIDLHINEILAVYDIHTHPDMSLFSTTDIFHYIGFNRDYLERRISHFFPIVLPGTEDNNRGGFYYLSKANMEALK